MLRHLILKKMATSRMSLPKVFYIFKVNIIDVNITFIDVSIIYSLKRYSSLCFI
jgi:hypothetical protein